MIKLNQLKYFVSSVESGSLTTAAKNLYISQPALSKQLVQLEHDLGCQLFNRKNTGIELTKAGRFFYEKASVILADIEQLTFEMRGFSKRSTIKIGTLPSIGSHLIPSLIPRINSKYKVELIIKETTSELVDMLEYDRIDVAFVQDASKYKNISVETLFYEPYDAILPKQLFNSDKGQLSLSDLLENSIILHKHPCDIREFFENYCKKNRLKYSMSMELEFNDSIIPFVSNGIGPSILPRMVSRQIENSTVVVQALSDQNFGRTIDFLYKQTIKTLAKEIYTESKKIGQNY